MKGEYIKGYAEWLDAGNSPGRSGAYLMTKAHLAVGRNFYLRYTLARAGVPGREAGYEVWDKDDPYVESPAFHFTQDIFKEYMIEAVRAQRFKKQLNRLIGNNQGETKMTRLTWKNVNGTLINNKPVFGNGTELSVSITDTFALLIVNTGTGVLSFEGQYKSLRAAKKAAKVQLSTLGVVFGSEVRDVKEVDIAA